MSALYRAAFLTATDAVKRRIAASYVRVLKEEGGARVTVYERRFFTGEMLHFMTEADRRVAKDHFLDSLNPGTFSDDLLAASEGFSKWIKPDELLKFFDPLIRIISYSRSSELIDRVTVRLYEEYFAYLPSALEARLITRLDQWMRMHIENDRHDAAERLENIISALSDVICQS